MDRKENQGNELKYKNIWNTTYAPIALILLIPIIIFLGVVVEFLLINNQFSLANTSNSMNKLYIILCLFTIPFFIIIILMIKEMIYYNTLVDDGILIKGNIKSLYYNGIGRIQIEVIFNDDNSGKQYIYKQSCYKNWDFYKLRIFAKENPYVKVLVKRTNYEEGYVLFDEYYYNQKRNDLYEKEPVFRSWRGQYKGYKKSKELNEKEVQIANAKIIKGKLLKESIKTQSDTRSTIILYADVSYFDPEKNKVIIFKGKYIGRPMVYWDIRKCKKDIYVQVAYDPEDSSQYKVYLEDALECLEV